MPNSNQSNNGRSDTVVTTNNQREKAKNIVDAHAEISRYSVLEMNNGKSHERMFAWDQVIEFFAIGFKIFGAGFVLCLFLIPVSVAANFGLINMYGGVPNIYDKIFIFILAFSMSFGAIVITLQMAKFVEGAVTYKMLRSLYTGAIASSFLKGASLFLLFQFAATLITPQNIMAHLNLIINLLPNAHNIAASTPYELSTALVGIIKPLFRISAVIMLIYGVLTSIILIGVLIYSKIKLKKKQFHDKFLHQNM